MCEPEKRIINNADGGEAVRNRFDTMPKWRLLLIGGSIVLYAAAMVVMLFLLLGQKEETPEPIFG